MTDAATLKGRVRADVARIAPELVQASDHLACHPEIGHQEHESVAYLRALLEGHGIASRAGIAGMDTAFRAELAGKARRPRIAILAEYDALPGVGHGCGHNIIGTAAIGAAVALQSVLADLPGSIVLLGTPCEESTAENAGGKVPLVEAGTFDDVDAAIMMHPGTLNSVAAGRSLAARGFDFEFAGRAAHAAARPYDGINALDAVIATFNGINALRQHVRSDVRIHGIVTNGGDAANVVPEYASCRFRVRSESTRYLDEVVDKVIKCAEGAALMMGATLSWTEYANPYASFVPNETLAQVGRDIMQEAGIQLDEMPADRGLGSTDLANVSHRTPAVTLRFSIGDPGLRSHSSEFAEATQTDRGHQALVNAAMALAMMAIELICDAAKLRDARSEWEQALTELG